MKHTTINNTVARSPCAYCKLKKCSLTAKQVKQKECLKKNCWHLVKYDHEFWRQRERAKAKKKANKQIDELLIQKGEINMADFIKLCEKIIDTEGNPSVQDVLSCGYTFEHFLRMAQPNIKADKLVHNAREALLARGIHYKEI